MSKIFLDKALQNCVSLYFAKYQVVIAEDLDDQNDKIRKLKKNYQEAGLTIKTNMSEYSIIGNDDLDNLELEHTEGVRT